MYREFLLPVYKEIIQRIGSAIALHIYGNYADRLSSFVEARFDAYHFEWQIDAREAVNSKMSLIGNASNTEVLYCGKPENVYVQARYSIEQVLMLLRLSVLGLCEHLYEIKSYC